MRLELRAQYGCANNGCEHTENKKGRMTQRHHDYTRFVVLPYRLPPVSAPPAQLLYRHRVHDRNDTD